MSKTACEHVYRTRARGQKQQKNLGIISRLSVKPKLIFFRGWPEQGALDRANASGKLLAILDAVGVQCDRLARSLWGLQERVQRDGSFLDWAGLLSRLSPSLLH